MDANLRNQLVAELMQRLGTEDEYERLAQRAGMPSLVFQGKGLELRYAQLVTRLWEQGPSSLASYLEAAALEAGGGFEVRFSLATQTPPSAWDSSLMRTAMIRMPPPELGGTSAEGSDEATQLAALSPLRTQAPPMSPPLIPEEAKQLAALQENSAKRAKVASPAPFMDFDKSVQIPSLALRLQQSGGKVDLEAVVEDHTRGAALGSLQLREARLVAGAGPGGVGNVLRLVGQGLNVPLFLELEGLTGRRKVERARGTDAWVLLTERNFSEFLPRRVRLVQRSEVSAWVEIKPGARADAGLPWPTLRSDASYVPAGDYRLPGEHASRRLEQGVQLGLTPVTNREFLAFVQRTGYKPTVSQDFLRHYDPARVDEAFWSQPVLFVSQGDAQAYCVDLGGSLPSVEAWERAALGFGQRLYPWGDEYSTERANTREGRHGWTTGVTHFLEGRGPYGHVDLAGNVWEWTSSPGVDPQHVLLKGGAWVNDRQCCQTAYRASHRPELRTFYIGFRVCWPIPDGMEDRKGR
ncbi:MAG: formylglycine-generating enzyme family protein [Myxococcota bacterium]